LQHLDPVQDPLRPEVELVVLEAVGVVLEDPGLDHRGHLGEADRVGQSRDAGLLVAAYTAATILFRRRTTS
jgi:hypothetical protein